MSTQKQWDTEEVLAFVHDVRPWRELSDTERVEWVRRVKHVRDNVTTDGTKWTNERLAGLFGFARRTLQERLSSPERIKGGGDPKPRSGGQQSGDARRFFNNPVVTGERKAEVVADALTDDYVAEQVAYRITGDPDLMAQLESARKRLDRKEKPPAEQSLADEWQTWLSKLNNILTQGARLADRTEVEGDEGTIPQVALYAYQMIIEKELDAELRTLLELEGVH